MSFLNLPRATFYQFGILNEGFPKGWEETVGPRINVFKPLDQSRTGGKNKKR